MEEAVPQGQEAPFYNNRAERISDDDDAKAAFECNICYDIPQEPVVTFCGHLYCWPCLYRWLHATTNNSSCPVCKGSVDAMKVIPIYGRGHDSETRRGAGKQEVVSSTEKPIPARPGGLRPPSNTGSGMGIIPGLNIPGGQELFSSQEQQHQAFLSRLLLMLGSFVIMCLLLF